MLNPSSCTWIFLVGMVIPGAGTVSAQDYPNRPIRIVTGSVGGGSDFTSRQIASGISGPLGQPVIVENRASIIASEVVSKAPPDGYTLLVGGAGVWLTPLSQKMNYDMADFAPLSLISRDVNILVVHPSVPVKSVKELIALAKARPGELNYSASLGTALLASELFKSMAGVRMVHIPYKGAGPAITALVSGEAQLTINEAGLLAPHVKSGKARALAVTSATPSTLTPGLPTVAESGVPGYEWVGMTHLLAPAKTPAAIVNRLNQEIVRFLNRAEVKARFLSAGTEIVASSPEELATIIKSDIDRITRLIRDAGLKLN